MDSPLLAAAELAREPAMHALRNFYDEILIYGDRRVMDVGSSYRLPPDVRAKSTYVGFVCPPLPRVEAKHTVSFGPTLRRISVSDRK